jgi:hypothetical protein
VEAESFEDFFGRLFGTWVAAGASAATATGLAVVAREARSAVHDGH